MIRMEMIRTEKEAAGNRLKKYQQTIKRKGAIQHDSSKSVCRGCDTAD